MAWLQQQQQLILRLPDHLARISRKLLNKEKGKTSPMVEIRPQDEIEPSNDFIFVINGKEYPALLMNLPTPLETHKTFDNKIFLKAGDIGQVLQVFDTPEEREAARNKICKTLHGDYMPSGVTPPTADIVKRRFELTRKNETFLPYRIRAVIEEINSFGSGTGRMVPAHTADSAGSATASGGSAVGGAGGAPGGMLEVVSESTTEEVVDFEEWMVDTVSQSRRTGISITLSGSELSALKDLAAAAGSSSSSGTSANNNARLSNTAAPLLLLLQHPEILVTEEEREEDQIDALAAEQAKEQRRKNSISLTVDEASTQMNVVGDVGGGAATTLTLPRSAHTSSAASAPTTAASNGGTEASTSSSISGTEPLKLSLSMRRPAATAPGASSSTVSLTTAATTGAAPVGQTSDQDVAMLQDEEGDENSGDDAEGRAENTAESDEEAPDPDAGGTIFDMLDSSDDEDAENNEGEGEDQENGDDGQDYDESAEGIAAESSAMASAYHAQMRATTQYATSSSALSGDNEADNEDATKEGGDAENAGEDVDSVNSDDSDAWMREV